MLPHYKIILIFLDVDNLTLLTLNEQKHFYLQILIIFHAHLQIIANLHNYNELPTLSNYKAIAYISAITYIFSITHTPVIT